MNSEEEFYDAETGRMVDHAKNFNYDLYISSLVILFSLLRLLQVWNQMTPVTSALKMPLVLRANGHLMAVCDQRMECGNEGVLPSVRKSAYKKGMYFYDICVFLFPVQDNPPCPHVLQT